MKEKFRGKNKKGQWVYGYLMGEKYIGTFDPKKPKYEEVLPETVGQRSDVMASNGIVWEGDIVSHISEWDGIDHKLIDKVVFEDGAFRAGEGGRELSECDKLEIIGNTSDNPNMKYGFYQDI